MDRRQTVAKVSTLIRLGETAEEVYGCALPKLGEPAARRLAPARSDHHAQTEAMRSLLESLGEQEEPRSQDFEWFAESLVRRAALAHRPAEALAGARQAEAAVLLHYADAAQVHLPLQVGRLVRRHLERNEAHLDLIDELAGARRG